MKRSIARKLMITDALVRCDDDIKSLFLKLKEKVKEAVSYFKSLPSGKKITLIFSKILQYVGGFISGYNTVNAVKAAYEIRKLYSEAKNTIEVEVEMPGGNGFEAVDKTGGKSYFSMLKSNPSFYKPLLTTIGGLIMAICGYILDTYSKA